MKQEIERKFLVRRERLPKLRPGDELEQGYLSVDPVVRVRLRVAPTGAQSAHLTIKGRGTVERAEFEYSIRPNEARALLGICRRSLRKVRYVVGRWEIDRFLDRDLWLAEIELKSPDEPFERPPWVGDEVTDDPSYTNASLARELPPG
jgi:CYTH domain-containing protein